MGKGWELMESHDDDDDDSVEWMVYSYVDGISRSGRQCCHCHDTPSSVGVWGRVVRIIFFVGHGFSDLRNSIGREGVTLRL